MSYQEQGEKLNSEFKKCLNEIDLDGKDIYLRDLIDAILRFGQIAKFRCRSNVAYDNFCNVVFKDIVSIERRLVEGQTFEKLQVKEVKIGEKKKENDDI